MPRSPRWTDDDLRAAVAASTSLRQVCLRLGLVPGRYDTLRRHITRLNLDTTHLPGRSSPRRRRRFVSDDEFAKVVRLSYSIAEVMRRLGYRESGGMHRLVAGRIARLNLDNAHFTGQSWALGRKLGPRRVIPLEEVLVRNSTYGSTSRLRRRLIAAGLKKPECEECGLREWRGKPLSLALDHVNGDHTDNRLENLRILCPNCHALTDTWCSRNRRPA